MTAAAAAAKCLPFRHDWRIARVTPPPTPPLWILKKCRRCGKVVAK